MRIVFQGFVCLLVLFLAAQVQAAAVRSWGDIPREAMTRDGQARVIVEFEVPDYAELSHASAEATPMAKATPARKSRALRRMTVVDAALSQSIAGAGNEILSGLAADGYSVTHRYKYVPMMAVTLSAETLSTLTADPRVKRIQADGLSRVPQDYQSRQSRDSGDRQGAARLADTMDLIGADVAWEMGYTGDGVYVAVLDTGILNTHEFFQDKTIVEACFSYEYSCPNNSTEMYGPGAAAHFPYPGSSTPVSDHGTHVTGIAVGDKPDGTMHGVAKDADIIAVNVFSFIPDWYDVGSYYSDQILGLEYVYGLRGEYVIGAVNMSLGGGYETSYCEYDSRAPIIDLLYEVGIPVTVSSGNERYCSAVGSPACLEKAVAVQGSDKTDGMYTSGNWHPRMIDIVAPGVSINSSLATTDTSYGVKTGTSMAAPHVAGAFALQRQFSPANTVDQMLANLLSQGPEITSICGDGLGKPRLNVEVFVEGDHSSSQPSTTPILPLLLTQE